MSDRIGRFNVSFELLKQALFLPEGTEILAVRQSQELPYAIEVKARDDGLDEVNDGDPIPLVRPLLKRIDDVPVFHSWGK